MARRAPRFREFIGHAKIVAQLRRELTGSLARGEPMPHVLLTGTSGVGKTQLARALAAERGVRLVRIMGTASSEELIGKLKRLHDGDFLFLDEAHCLTPALQELLFEVIDRHKIRVTADKRKGQKRRPKTTWVRLAAFTIVLATDRPSGLLNALKKRIPTPINLPRYNATEMKEIVATIAAHRAICLSAQATKRLAAACQGLPRKADHLLQRLPYHVRADRSQISADDVRRFLHAIGLDARGWGRTERMYLHRLRRFESASLETLALVLDTDKEDVLKEIEPPLVRSGLVKITASGRKLTSEGEKWVSTRVRRHRLESTHQEVSIP